MKLAHAGPTSILQDPSSAEMKEIETLLQQQSLEQSALNRQVSGESHQDTTDAKVGDNSTVVWTIPAHTSFSAGN